METLLQWGMIGILALLLAAFIGVLTALPVMLLWNAVVPGIFGLQAINFTEALMLSLLSSILFKSPSSSSSN